MSLLDDTHDIAALQAEIERRSQVEERLSQSLADESARGAANEQQFRMLVESVRDYAIFLLDPAGRIATWNSGAERLKGYTADEAIGMHFSRFYSPEEVASGKCEANLETAAREGRFEEVGWRFRKDGSTFWANVVIGAIRNAQDELVGFSKVTRDLTERKRAEDERAGRIAAEHANRMKDEFLAMLGHELRNPMAPIVTALELIALRGDMTAQKEHQVIERQVKHMMHLIDDLLDVSRIASGKITLRRQPIDLRTVITKAVELASPLFEQKRHHLAVQVPSTPLVITADDARLTQVVANLLTNAAKYTPPEGRVTVVVRERPHELEIEVTDTGAGIGSELLPRIYDTFVQGHQTSDRSGGGLGLGLTLVKSLVALHGGTVAAHSDGPGTGSRFTVVLPTTGPRLVVESLASAPDDALFGEVRDRVLVVDDNEDARHLLGELLRSMGYDVAVAADAPEALELAQTFGPNVAILDIGLPVVDGYELATRMRDLLGRATPALIAVTGYGQETDRALSHAAGFQRHLVKPVDLRQLLDAIAQARLAR